jgi:2-dehydro-3-deoxyphosphogluconate aldolase/(4S)-4-hydroxy-2-oxoglutarate aldolase
MNTKEIINENKVIAIMRGVAKEKAADAARALNEGGIKLVEVTFNQSSPTCIEDTADSIKSIIDAMGDKMCVGAGTVMTVEQVRAAVDAGAKYIISPNTDKEVIEETKKLGAISLPGAFTPSEAVSAYKMGADYVKLFPAGLLGISYIKAIKAPISHIPLMAVGGVNADNLGDFLATGINGVGVGSSLVNLKLINAGKWDELTALAKKFAIGE